MKRASTSLGIAVLVVLATAIAVAASGTAPDEPAATSVASTAASAEAGAEAGAEAEVRAPEVNSAPEGSPGGEARAHRERPDRPSRTADGHERPRPERVEPLRLHCRGGARDGEAGVVCGWSEARHPAFAGYQLWRGDRESGRQVVFRTDDRSQVRYLDRDVVAGTGYVYVITAVDAGGNVIGRSDPVRVQAGAHERPRPERVEPLRLHCRGGARDGEAGVVCGWSEARHPAFAGYQLWRGDRESGRQVVFRTDDRSQVRYVDRDVVAGTDYVYVITAVDAEGNVVGRSDPVRVQAGANDPGDETSALDPHR